MKNLILLTFFILSLNAYSLEFSRYLCNLSFDSKQYPILENQKTSDLTKNWLSKIDDFYLNKSMTAEEFARASMVSSEIHTIETMKKKLKELDPRALYKRDLAEEIKRFNLNNKELTLELYPKWLDQRLSSLEKNIEKILANQKLSYYELVYHAEEYSHLIDPFQYIGNFDHEITQYTRNNPFKESEFLKYYMTRVEPNVKPAIHRYPFFMAIPTFESLGFRAINRMNGVPVFYVGLIDKAMVVDGQIMRPGYFHFHDYAHFNAFVDKVQATFMKFNGEKYIDFTKLKYLLTQEQFKGVVDQLLEVNFVYGRYNQLISDTAKFSSYEKVVGEGLYFYLAHEVMAVDRMGSMKAFKQYLLEMTESTEVSDLNNFIRRINDQKDLGQAFKPAAPERTRESIVALIQKILIDL